MKAQVKRLLQSTNVSEQYSRRQCLEIRGIEQPRSSEGSESTNTVVIKLGSLMGINIQSKDISVSHRLPIRQMLNGKVTEPGIIVKFISGDIKLRSFIIEPERS